MRSRLKGLIGVLLIFLCGAICGGVVASGSINQKVRTLVSGGPDRVVDYVAKKLRDDLQLDNTQRQELEKVMVETRGRLAAIREKTQPETVATLMEAGQKVRALLTPEQAPKFDEIVRKGRERWKVEELKPGPASKREL